MNTIQQAEAALLKHLYAWLREEIPAQRQRLDSLRALCASMAKADPKECETLLDVVQSDEQSARGREARIRTILGRFAELWQLEAAECSLRTVAERLPAESSQLLALRSELHTLMEELTFEAKRLTATARVHRGLILEVLNSIFDPAPGDPLEEQGHLLDAEA